MKCPFCEHREDKVVDSRPSKSGDAIRRRRECLKCEKRFTTYEQVEDVRPMVVKKDGKREPFERTKVLNGLLKACEKRPVPARRLEEIVDEERTKAAGRARVARDSIDMTEIQMQESEQDALEEMALADFAAAEGIELEAGPAAPEAPEGGEETSEGTMGPKVSE